MLKAPRLVILFFASLFIAACGDSEKQNKATAPNTHTLIFIDKTESVDVNKPFVAQKYQQALNSIIEQNINKAGDQLEIYYIHENTSKARCLSLMSRTDMEDLSGMNATDLEAAKTSYELSIKKERGFILKQAISKLNQQNNTASNLETNISASVPVIAKASEGQAVVKVYYFSDMVESVKAGRDFHIKSPKDNTEAEEWAKADADKYKNYAFNGPEVTMILPFEPTTSSKENNPTVTYYWQKFFENLGVMSVQEL
ncbi:MAG: hypothetical protein MUF45_08185 [Spirosomaceae bacterium]|jgi:hypothetical protein|nr:hypothetical protein [Spirosomataceae bacterium]